MDETTLRVALTVDPELPVPPTHYGGIERIVDLLAKAVVARGHHVTLFAHPQSTCPVPTVGWPGQTSGSRLDTLRNAITLARHVATGRFDIIHSFSRIAYLGPILPFPIPKLMSYQREISPNTTHMAHRLSRGSLEFSALSRHMIEAADLAGHWHLVPNGVPLDTYTFRGAVDSDAPLVFLGRIEEIKGPHIAIEVARRTGRKLILAGNIPDAHRAWFEAHVEPHLDDKQIRYIGPVTDAQKNELLGRSLAFLMPILWEEPFGIVMAEAMACGTPVLGLRRGAVPEIVHNAVTGFVVDTVDELTTAIERVPVIDRAACRARVEQLYSEAAVTEGYIKIYRQMVVRPRSELNAQQWTRARGIGK
jgi:glycosyltransferase involved in cell wall biosynthesis